MLQSDTIEVWGKAKEGGGYNDNNRARSINFNRIYGLKVTFRTVGLQTPKLSSYARKNRTKKALWELDNIVKTLYILKYVDSIELRRNVQKALNRGEAYNKLRKAVFYAFFGKFRVKTELEQQIWSECTRLITNAIIFFRNYSRRKKRMVWRRPIL